MSPIGHFTVGRETRLRFLSKCIVNCFGGRICRHVEIRPPKQSQNALWNHLDPVSSATSKWLIAEQLYCCHCIQLMSLKYVLCHYVTTTSPYAGFPCPSTVSSNQWMMVSLLAHFANSSSWFDTSENEIISSRLVFSLVMFFNKRPKTLLIQDWPHLVSIVTTECAKK